MSLIVPISKYSLHPRGVHDYVSPFFLMLLFSQMIPSLQLLASHTVRLCINSYCITVIHIGQLLY